MNLEAQKMLLSLPSPFSRIGQPTCPPIESLVTVPIVVGSQRGSRYPECLTSLVAELLQVERSNPHCVRVRLFGFRKFSSVLLWPDHVGRANFVALDEIPARRLTRFLATEIGLLGPAIAFAYGLDRKQCLEMSRWGVEPIPICAGSLELDRTIVDRSVAALLCTAGGQTEGPATRQETIPLLSVGRCGEKFVIPRQRIRRRFGLRAWDIVVGIGADSKDCDHAITESLSALRSIGANVIAISDDGRRSERHLALQKIVRGEEVRCLEPSPEMDMFDALEVCDLYVNVKNPWSSAGTYLARYLRIPVLDLSTTPKLSEHSDVTSSIGSILKNRSIESSLAGTVSAQKACGWLLPWYLEYGLPHCWPETKLSGAMFITNNLSRGGAQRSLVNLLERIGDATAVHLMVLDEVFTELYRDRMVQANVNMISAMACDTSAAKVHTVLAWLKRLKIGTLCFWNADPGVKAALVKVLLHTPIKIIEVSPGPRLFHFIDASPVFEDIGLTRSQYFERLDKFVPKYRNGSIPRRYGEFREKTVSISNGVESAAVFRTAAGKGKVRPKGINPQYAIVSCGRLVPAKLIERQLEVAAIVRRSVPAATLTVVGGVEEEGSNAYWTYISDTTERLSLQHSVHFVGTRMDSLTFLHEFAVFLMLSYFQGCPNASLEAMACGLPVVANPDGGTSEQVLHGKTGYLAPDWDPEQIAERIVYLLRNPAIAKKLGEAGRNRAKTMFSLESMANRYLEVLRDVGGSSPREALS